MPTYRIVSPERRWRAGSLVVLAAWVVWRAIRYPGPWHGAAVVTGCVVAVGLLAGVIPAMKTCLVVSEEGLTDRRALRSVRAAWPQIQELRVARPGGVWGGFCIVVTRRDGAEVDLLSTRAYSRVPFSRHLDELQRICWTLEEHLFARSENPRDNP
jgi:Bacterial PH domain